MNLSRRRFLTAVAAAPAFAQRPARPNLVFLLTDDHRWDALGAMGNRIIRTPHLDKLCERGVTFGNAFVTTSICMTSRASFLSGLYARAHKIHSFQTPFTAAQFERTYPALLREHGYHTGLIGKYGVGSAMPEDRFDFWRGFPGQGRYFPDGEPGPHLTERMGDQAAEFLAGAPKNRPFCLSISFKAPHVQDDDPRQFLPSPATANLYRNETIPAPKTADPRYIGMLPAEVQRSEGRRRWAVRFSTPALFQESVKNYYRLITEVDTVVGRIREDLERRGVAENTVIVFAGDNGFYLGEHGLAGKWLMHEESIRVPLVVYDPRLPAARHGARVDRMALNIDVAPTLLHAAGIPAPAATQGRNLYPLLEASAPPAWRGEWFYEHEFTNGWIPKTEGVRTERWKYTRYIDCAPVFEELFDLAADPLEERNLAAAPEHRTMIERLRARWSAWRGHLDSWNPAAPWKEPA
jgi:arylsulfatase A-like enzyme